MDSFGSHNLDFTDLSSVGINPSIIPNQNNPHNSASVSSPSATTLPPPGSSSTTNSTLPSAPSAPDPQSNNNNSHNSSLVQITHNPSPSNPNSNLGLHSAAAILPGTSHHHSHLVSNLNPAHISQINPLNSLVPGQQRLLHAETHGSLNALTADSLPVHTSLASSTGTLIGTQNSPQDQLNFQSNFIPSVHGVASSSVAQFSAAAAFLPQSILAQTSVGVVPHHGISGIDKTGQSLDFGTGGLAGIVPGSNNHLNLLKSTAPLFISTPPSGLAFGTSGGSSCSGDSLKIKRSPGKINYFLHVFVK